jgi:hypothetical protein
MAPIVRYQLELGGEVVARIDVLGHEFPFTYGRLVDSPAFERFRRYFTDDNDWAEDDPEIEALCGEIQDCGGFLLREMLSGVFYRGVCLNHDGSEGVWFRHGDPA